MNPKDKHADWLLKPTANELADALDWVCENHLIGIGNADFKATATMLRQQQAEIEALKSRELTDEEILNIAHQIRLIDRQTADDGHLYFARAIMKRCGIISGTDK